MLKYLVPNIDIPKRMVLFSKQGCPICEQVRQDLTSRQLPFEEVFVGEQVSATSYYALSGSPVTPSLFVEGKRYTGASMVEEATTECGASDCRVVV